MSRPAFSGILDGMSVRCLIVDDSPAVLRAVRELLQREGMTVVGVTRTGDEAVRLVAELQPDVTLVDIDLGPESGFDLARRLAQTPDTASRTVLVSTHDEGDYADLIAASPAIGFLAKMHLSASAIQELLQRRADDGEARY